MFGASLYFAFTHSRAFPLYPWPSLADVTAMQSRSPTSLPLAPAYYIGTQEGLPASGNRVAVPSFDLYNLTAPLGDLHPIGSTVSAQTLIAHGFALPPKP